MWALLACATTLLLAASLIACGGDTSPGGQEDNGTPETDGAFAEADPEDVRVIREWADALRGGDVERASESFAIPSVAENGPQLIRIRSRGDARRFNESLPCGAVLIEAKTVGELTTATFELTERPGPGSCGPGVGEAAMTSFLIEDGEIAEWRRVGIAREPESGRSA